MSNVSVTEGAEKKTNPQAPTGNGRFHNQWITTRTLDTGPFIGKVNDTQYKIVMRRRVK